MIVERSTHPDHLSNSWLVGDRRGGPAVIVDTGAPPDPILRAIDAHRLRPEVVLCTHHHGDHVAHNADYRRRFGCTVAAHPLEASRIGGVERELSGGEELRCGALTIRVLHLPGHTQGQLGFVFGSERVFTGDTLFLGSVGGTLGPGASGLVDLRRSIMDVLMRLPAATVVHPGHAGETTIGQEWERNPFVRAWRGLDAPSDEPCLAAGRPARLLLRAADYDGGSKCWVRFEHDGSEAVLGGSRVRRAP